MLPRHCKPNGRGPGLNSLTWDKVRPVVAKVEWHQGELFPRVGFIVANLRQDRQNLMLRHQRRAAMNPTASGT